MPILGDFAVKYGSRARELGVPADDLYQALVDTAENTVRPRILPPLIPMSKPAHIATRLVHGYVPNRTGTLLVFVTSIFTLVGRQNTAWKMFDYIPTDWVDPSGATGLMTREASRTLEVHSSHPFFRVLLVNHSIAHSTHWVTSPSALCSRAINLLKINQHRAPT